MDSSTETVPIGVDVEQSAIQSKHSKVKPVQLSGALSKEKSFDVTLIIGREFPKVNLKRWFEAPRAD